MVFKLHGKEKTAEEEVDLEKPHGKDSKIS